MNERTYRWTGRVEGEHVLRVDQVIEIASGTEVELVASPKDSTPSEDDHEVRLKAWKEFLALPSSEEDKRFWAEIEKQATDARRASRWREAHV